MDWLVGLLLLVVGMIIGFFAAKFLLERKYAEQAEKASDSTLKEMMAQHAADHLSQSREIVATLQSQCEDLNEQLDAYENVLNASQMDDSKDNLTFFGEHATLFIRHQQAKQKRKTETAEFQPKDFSTESSGLFTDAKNKQVVDNK